MHPYFNFRNILLVVLTLALIAVKFITDPSDGAITKEFLLYVTTPFLVVLIGHWLRKLLFPYVDMGDLYSKAKDSSVGAAIIFLGMTIIVFAIYGLFGPAARAQSVDTYVPVQAFTYAPVLKVELDKYWVDIPKKSILVV